MSVRTFKRNGIYWVDIRDNGSRLRYSLKTRNKQIAITAAAKIEIEQDRKRLGLDYDRPVASSVPIDIFVQKISAHIKARLSPATISTYLDTFTIFIAWLKSNRKYEYMGQVRRADIEDFITYRRQKICARSANNNIQQLKTIFYKAMKIELCDKNPVKGVDFLPNDSPEKHHYTQDELEMLFDVFPDRFKPFFTVLLHTGLRKGELLLLEWEDIYLKEKYIKITPRAERTSRKMKPRIIPLTDAAIDALKARMKLWESDKQVFTNEIGGELRKNTLYDVLQRAKKNAGVRNGNLHSFRHTYATRLLEKGMSIKIVKDLLGHENISTTEIYSHIDPLKYRDMLNLALSP